ncbi:hypothetical protein NMY22_g9420 [Coprinellus aureogranulatus]|nr:hypothetical protein NMY22_g9420 [Coprinellus aureogranulatus]
MGVIRTGSSTVLPSATMDPFLQAVFSFYTPLGPASTPEQVRTGHSPHVEALLVHYLLFKPLLQACARPLVPGFLSLIYECQSQQALVSPTQHSLGSQLFLPSQIFSVLLSLAGRNSCSVREMDASIVIISPNTSYHGLKSTYTPRPSLSWKIYEKRDPSIYYLHDINRSQFTSSFVAVSTMSPIPIFLLFSPLRLETSPILNL